MEATNGIVLNGHPYGDYGLIAVVFTEKQGLLKFALPFQRAAKNKWRGLFLPLQEIELQFKLTLKELETVKQACLLSPHLELRNSLEVLEAASLMAKALLQTLPPGESSPVLYALFKKYLFLLPQAPHPSVLLASFKMKTLMHEGLLDPEELVSSDRNFLTALCLTRNVQRLFELPKETESLVHADLLFDQILSSQV